MGKFPNFNEGGSLQTDSYIIIKITKWVGSCHFVFVKCERLEWTNSVTDGEEGGKPGVEKALISCSLESMVLSCFGVSVISAFLCSLASLYTILYGENDGKTDLYCGSGGGFNSFIVY